MLRGASEQVAGAGGDEALGEPVVPGVEALPLVVLLVPGADALELGEEALVVAALEDGLVALGVADYRSSEGVRPLAEVVGVAAGVDLGPVAGLRVAGRA